MTEADLVSWSVPGAPRSRTCRHRTRGGRVGYSMDPMPKDKTKGSSGPGSRPHRSGNVFERLSRKDSCRTSPNSVLLKEAQKGEELRRRTRGMPSKRISPSELPPREASKDAGEGMPRDSSSDCSGEKQDEEKDADEAVLGRDSPEGDAEGSRFAGPAVKSSEGGREVNLLESGGTRERSLPEGGRVRDSEGSFGLPPEGSVEPRASKETGLRPLDDDDKDVCEDDPDDPCVRTRLVSYRRKALVIRKTTKGLMDAGEDVGRLPPRPPRRSNPTQEVREVPGGDPREKSPKVGFAISGTLKDFVNRGRALLHEVWDSTQAVLSHQNAWSFRTPLDRTTSLIDLPSKARDDVAGGGARVLSAGDMGGRVRKEAASATGPPLSGGDAALAREPDFQDPRSVEELKESAVEGPSGCAPSRTEEALVRMLPCESYRQKGEPGEADGRLCVCLDVGERPSVFEDGAKELLSPENAKMWWTITGNFGNILPIDWSKTCTRQKYLPVLNLNEQKGGVVVDVSPASKGDPSEDEEDEVAQDLDLHHLILSGLSQEPPVKSADEVIREIDDIMQEASGAPEDDEALAERQSPPAPETKAVPPPLYEEKLKDLSVSELNEVYMELELVIRQYSETLIAQLALRDELEFEKELKNSFISLLLQVQNKRRNYNVEKKKMKKPSGPNGVDPKYLTTVIPYDVGHGPPGNETLQILIKIMTAINEDSPTVPTLLTDYILKVLCPS